MDQQLKLVYDIFNKYPKINTDTRQMLKDSIFFALKGKNFNANEYASIAIKNGAAFAIIDDNRYKKSDRFILVDDVLDFLQQLAIYHRKQLKIPIIGITGSNGKTTTKELIFTALSTRYKVIATKGNLNNHIGVPLSVLSIDSSAEIAIIEMGANHIGEIKDLCKISQPDYGIITNIGSAHLEGFGSIEGVIKAKSELYKYIEHTNGSVFVNADDELLMQLSNGMKRILYGKSNQVGCQGILLSSIPQVIFEWKSKFDNKELMGKVQSQLFGNYNFQNLLAATCIASYFKLNNADIDPALSSYVSKNNRSEIVESQENTIVLDAYNANPSSMQAAITTFMEDRKSNNALILGDMFELGAQSESEHKKIVDLVESYEPSIVIFVGKHFLKHSRQKNHFFESRMQAEQYLKKHPLKNKRILIKGSRGIELEKLLQFIP